MFKIQELLPFIVVDILGIWVGSMSLSNRPNPADISKIHDSMQSERESNLSSFVAMGFSGEVLSNEFQYRKYPLPDERYFSKIKLTQNLVMDSLVGEKGRYFDFSQKDQALWIMGSDGRSVNAGDMISKAPGDSAFVVTHADGSKESFNLDWRLFVKDSLYEE